MSAQRGSTQLILVVVAIIVVGLVGFFFLNKQGASLPVPENHQEQPKFNIKSEYQNPFRQTEKQQYVNPFENLK